MHATLQHFPVQRRCRSGSVFPSVSFCCALLIVTGVLLSGSWPLAAADGRDFAGSYQLTDIVDQRELVLATFTTRVFNYSDADASGATVMLDSRLVPGQTYWSLPSVSIVNRGNVRLRCLITIPRAEYNSWQQGALPNLHVDTANGAGTLPRRRVELIRNPLGEEK
jgi:hypothetical protein